MSIPVTRFAAKSLAGDRRQAALDTVCAWAVGSPATDGTAEGEKEKTSAGKKTVPPDGSNETGLPETVIIFPQWSGDVSGADEASEQND